MDFDPKKDYYKILGVDENATTAEIKKAFRKLAIKYHPDRWGSKEKFQEINEAHGVLSDENKRKQYDAYRKGDFSWGFGGNGGFDFWGFWWEWFDIWDIFGNLFGGFWWEKAARSTKGNDLKKIIEITFEEAYLWTQKKISYSRLQKVSWVDVTTCPQCNGRWKVSQAAQTPFGIFQTQTACHHCGGMGKIFTKNGRQLENWWLESIKESLEIKIPEGIKEGAYIKYVGKGDAWIWDVPDGDLFLKIHVIESEKYRREWDDLFVKADVSLFDLVLWGEIEISHPEGKIKVKVPKGTQIGDKIKISGKGFWWKGLFQSRGNLYIETKVSIPKRLTKEEEKLWQELKNHWK